MATSPHYTESLAYGEETALRAATALRRNVDMLRMAVEPALEVTIKTDPKGATSPVTVFDQATERYIGERYSGTDVRIKGEEGVTAWPEGQQPTYDLHVDPIDGTELFIGYFSQMIDWSKAPRQDRPPRPTSGPMVSIGAALAGSVVPTWGAIAAPFLTPDGIVRWSAGPCSPARRIDADGSVHLLPRAEALDVPERGGVVLVPSGSSERLFGPLLEAVGYRVVKYKSAVATALAMMDPGLLERLVPGGSGGDPVVGVVMRNAKNWDVAAVMAIAADRGHFVSGTDGRPRELVDGRNGAIFAVTGAVGQQLAHLIAPALQD